MLSVFVGRYLINDKKKFREYFRVSLEMFQIILAYNEEDISQKPDHYTHITTEK